MPWCLACDVNLPRGHFSSNQLSASYESRRRCVSCIRSYRQVGSARREREERERQERQERERQERQEREERERLERERLEREERERLERERQEREERERMERERQERARRDAELEAQLSKQIRDISEMEERLRSLKQGLGASLAAAPAFTRYRLTGPVTAGLMPMQQWSTETALVWFEESFPWADLYRAGWRASGVDGRLLWLVGDPSRPDLTPMLTLGISNALHSAALMEELAAHHGALERSRAAAAAAPNAAPVAGECIVCHDEAAVEAALPCGHLCFCSTCSARLLADPSPRCPICRAAMERAQRIYLTAAASSSSSSEPLTAGCKRQRTPGSWSPG